MTLIIHGIQNFARPWHENENRRQTNFSHFRISLQSFLGHNKHLSAQPFCLWAKTLIGSMPARWKEYVFGFKIAPPSFGPF